MVYTDSPLLSFCPRITPRPRYPGSRFPLRPCTPRPGGCVHTVLHSTHRRLLSLSLPSAACLCLRYPDPLQGKDLSYGRTFLEHWVRGPPLRGVCIPGSLKQIFCTSLCRELQLEHRNSLLGTFPHPVLDVKEPLCWGIIPSLYPFF